MNTSQKPPVGQTSFLLRPGIWPWWCAVLSGLLLTACYEPIGWENVSWIALAPLATAIWFSKSSTPRLLGLGYVTGIFYFGGSLFWLTTLTIPGWFLLAAILSLYVAGWALFFGKLCAVPHEECWLSSWHNIKVCTLGAAGWVATEWLRGVLFSGFGWNALGIAQHANIPLIQIADLTGVGGVSFLLAMASLMAVATVARLKLELGRGARRAHYDFALTIALIVLAWSYGLRQIMAPPHEMIAVTFAAVQGNIPQAVRNDPAHDDKVMEAYRRHTETAIAGNPNLILWPESAMPRPVFNDQGTWNMVRGLAETYTGDLLLGTVRFTETGDYNSVALINQRGEAAQVYDKMHLVPFGEYVPFRKSFPFFAWVVGDLVPGDFDAGREAVVLEMASQPVTLAPLVCFEDTLGDLARRFVLLGGELFVVVTNNGWFLESAGSRQHLHQAVFRCAENKLPMVRAANTGITCVVNHFGAVQAELANPDGNTFIEGILFNKVLVPIRPEPTFYARYGEIFSQSCLGVMILFISLSIVKRVVKGFPPRQRD